MRALTYRLSLVLAGLVWTCIATTFCGCSQTSGFVTVLSRIILARRKLGPVGDFEWLNPRCVVEQYDIAVLARRLHGPKQDSIEAGCRLSCQIVRDHLRD